MTPPDSTADSFHSLEDALAALKAGRLVIVVDAEERENEGDLICAAEKVTPELVDFMLRRGAGVLCAPLLQETAERLGLAPIVDAMRNTAPNQTHFLTPIDHREAGSGVSANNRTRTLLDDLKLHTVCESAKCPNHWECWSRSTATFMIAGDRCTRACGFCAVSTAKPLALEPDEPQRVAEAARRLKLRHIVITAVARDDLPDGGARHFQRTIEAVRAENPAAVIEVLTPDFLDKDAALELVLDARPDIFNHNLETVRRLTPSVRHRATYDRSLSVLSKARDKARGPLKTKSGLMLGLGESRAEILEALADLRSARVDVLTLGQYLQPTWKHLPVVEYVPPAVFESLRLQAEAMGFSHVASGPLVRSSYHADEVAL